MYLPCDAFASLFARLRALDELLAANARGDGRCSYCGGGLHAADYPRKPRGGGDIEKDATVRWRVSFCCGRDGCRRRLTPPSVRFLGRRVYFAVIVLLVSVLGCGPRPESLAKLRQHFGPSVRTILRWRAWWRADLPGRAFWRARRGQFLPVPAAARLPRSLLEAWPAADATSTLCTGLLFLSPLSTGSFPDPFLQGADRARGGCEIPAPTSRP